MPLVLLHQLGSQRLNNTTYIMQKQTPPSTVKIKIALKRATHKSPPTDRLNPTTCLLSEVVLIVILWGHLHEVSFGARVEIVVHCSGRSGKTVKAENKHG